MIQSKCPKCGNVTELADDQAGQSVTCPDCGNVSIAPLPAEPVATRSEIPPPPVTPTVSPVMSDKDSRMWGMLCHLAALAIFTGIPFGNIIGPLVVWLIQKDKSPFVNEQGKESLNFQISMAIYGIVSAFLIVIIVGIFLSIAVVVVDIIFVIIASVKANNGESYRYPLTIRFLK